MRTLGPRSSERRAAVAGRAVAIKVAAHAVTVALAVGLGLGFCAGCGGRFAAATDPTTAYPEALYLVAVGSSPASYADAEQRARTAIAAQIRSTLESETTARTSTGNRDGVESYAATVDQTLRQDVAFSHAELIRVDLASRREDAGLYHVTAYLPRREAAQVLGTDYDAAAAAFARQAGTVHAVAAGDLPGFAVAFGEARRSWTVVQQRAMELWAITGRYPAGFAADQDRWRALLDRREQFLQGLRVAFDLLPVQPAGDRLDTVQLRQAFTAALAELGLAVRGRACEDGAGAYLVELQPRLHYQGLSVVSCRLDFAGRLVECASGQAWDLQIAHSTFAGEGSNTYEARNAAAARVSAEVLGPLLLAALRNGLPVD